MSSSPQHKDRIFLGAAMVVFSVLMIVSMNTIAKFLSGTYHPVEMVFYRNLIVFTGLATFLQFSNKWHLVKTGRIQSHIYRALIGTAGIVCGFWAVSLLPLADATTILYTAPLFVTALSVPLLGEKVGLIRWIAVITGFTGVILIVAPGGQDIILIGAAIALLAALFNALTQIALRDLGRTEHPLTVVFYFMSIGLLATGIFMPFIGSSLPRPEDFILLAALGLTGGLQQLIKTKGYALAPASITAPLNYTGLIWAALFGWLFWDTLPGWTVITGAAIIVASNSFILWRERTRKT